MKALKNSPFLLLMLSLISCVNTEKIDDANLQGFVRVSGLQYERKGEIINISDFEILDHPVTNLEYKAFVYATEFPLPLHWKHGEIQKGKEDYPVIFVNRDDVKAYTNWLTQITGRVHRIPTPFEFEIAACGGKKINDRYYWGNSEEMLTPENINFNNSKDRKYNQWEVYLKPSKWGLKNDLGLYQMAGNVWQFVTQNEDPTLAPWIFRLEKRLTLEREIMGGGWMSPMGDITKAKIISQPPGLRSPDLGIRLIREPEGANWNVINRKVVAITHSPGKIGISWALLNSDTKDTRFNIYRLKGKFCTHKGEKLNTEPLYNTSFVDEINIMKDTRYQYRVMTVDKDGKEGNPSDWAAIIAYSEQYPIVVKFKPVFEKGGMLPVFGDLEGYGELNCVIRLDNGCKETSQNPGLPVQLEAFSYTGKSLWRKDIAKHENIFGSASNAPFNVWDMTGDGKDEVITLYQIGDENYLAILDGMSGKLLNKTLWDKMATDFSLSSTRIQMSVAYLDGENPVIITQTGIYENEIISAYDKNLKKLWTFNSFMETSGSGGHKVEIADVDNDGKQEVIYGTTCLNSDGTFRWSIYRRHPDIISIHDYIPDRPGLEICYIVESSEHAGIYMVDANNGEVIWKNNREDDPVWSHGHTGWTADIWDGSPGMECMTNRAGHHDKTYLLFSSEGEKLSEKFPVGFYPIEWDGDNTRELIKKNGKDLGNFNGTEIILVPEECPNPVPNSTIQFSADLCGDFRSEIVINAVDTDGRPAIMVVGAPKSIEKRYLTPSQNIDYKLWLARNKGGGYGSVYEYVLKDTEK
ncbi:MAG: SUMF1/EgtB/PvdO family nonheme iron enzyme [Bacteroidales bacterium]|nr:SUMF1/EgtB/PvdO family nonheme iron enzyme [Bacteroidales bacterium]